MRSIKSLIMWIVILGTSVTFSAYIGFATYEYQQTMVENTEKNLRLQAINEASRFNAEVDEAASISIFMADLVESIPTYDTALITNMQRKLIKNNPLIYGTGFWLNPYEANPDKYYFSTYAFNDKNGFPQMTEKYNQPDYDYFSWGWWRIAQGAREPIVWTSPFFDSPSNSYMITGSSPIYKNNRQVGICSVDLSLRFVKDYLQQITVGNDAYAFIMDNHSIILSDYGPNSRAEKLSASELRELTDKISPLREPTSFYAQANGISNLIAVAPMDNNFKMVVVQPARVLYSVRNTIILRAVISFVLLLLLFIILLNFLIQRHLITPITITIKNVESIANGDFSTNQTPLPSTTEEMEGLMEGVYHMRYEIQILLKELQEQNKSIDQQNQEIGGLYQQASAMNKELTELLEQKQELLKKMEENTLLIVTALARAIEANDLYTRGHCERVSAYAVAMAKELYEDENQWITLEYAGLLHDIGKIAVPSEVLNKLSPLTENEWQLIQRHPQIGFNILKDLDMMKEVSVIILQHHERYDGKGYPYLLVGEEIDLRARILAVADAYDAMTSDRPYRKEPISHEEALDILLQNRDAQFDRKIVDLFVTLTGYEPGLSVNETPR